MGFAGNVTCENISFVVSNSQFWYLSPKNGGYYLVNFADTGKLLGVDTTPQYEREYYNSIWEVEPATVNIKYYYDGCYVARGGTSSTMAEYQQDVQDIFLEVFGITATTSIPRFMSSYSDLCYTSTINSTNVNDWCGHDGGLSQSLLFFL